MSSPVDEYLQPLCPLRVEAHKHRYLPVDSSQERFCDFTAAFADPAGWLAKGHLVVVTGDRGYGKTSLIQRCASWLREHPEPHLKTVIVDLSDERWSLAETEESRIRRTLDWMLDALRHDLQPEEAEAIQGHADLIPSFRDLGRMLGTRLGGADGSATPPIVLVVLLQGYPRPSEIMQYYNLARPGMFFFAEMLDREDIASLSAMMPGFNRVSTDARLLSLDVLKSGDASLLVEWIRREDDSWPEVPDEVVRECFDRVLRYNVGMAELARLTWGTLQVAAREPASKVTPSHIIEYYAQVNARTM